MRRTLTHPRALLTLVLIAITPVACSDDDDDPNGPPDTDPLVGTWNATSLLADGTELLGGGLAFSISFDEDGTYTTQVSGDVLGVFCEPPQTACGDSGDYTNTSTTLTLDGGTADETVVSYVIAGDVLTLTGDLDGTAAVLVFSRA